ncbi:integrator complex subunit 12 isoform X2 [Megachile rotundata]|nr:PREDICTED: integrator complex subunit 12-like isoform X2 [Megachile rotundata]
MAQRIWITHTPAAQPVCAHADTAYAAAGETRSRTPTELVEHDRSSYPYYFVTDQRLPTPRADRSVASRTMYEDAEDASDINENFFNALALLHSTDDNSTEKLQKMLDTFIERKYGFDKTLMARLPKKFVQNTKIRGKSFSDVKTKKHKDDVSCKTGSTSRISEDLYVANDSVENNWKTVKVFNADVEDYSEKGDVPRISIPDEGSGDGLLCKVCNGAKLGPLILLECQECQEVYHPLCHQPPVVDIDVFDPRIVWMCQKCVDISVDTLDVKKQKEIYAFNNLDVQEVPVEADMLEKSNERLSKNETTVAQNLLDCSVDNGLIEKGVFTQKVKNVSSNQLRKRVGSKLSVTRSVVK